MKHDDRSYDIAREAVRSYLRLVLLAIGLLAAAMLMSALQGCQESPESMENVTTSS